MENKCIVIIKNSNRDFAPSLTIQELIEFCVKNNIQFIACHIEEYEYEKIRHGLDFLGCVYDEHFCYEKSEYEHFRYMCTYDMDKQTVKFVKDNGSGKEEGYNLNLNKNYIEPSANTPFYKEFNSGKYGTGLKIYTTATVEDIMKYYSQHSIENNILGYIPEDTPKKMNFKKQEIANLRQLINTSYNN